MVRRRWFTPAGAKSARSAVGRTDFTIPAEGAIAARPIVSAMSAMSFLPAVPAVLDMLALSFLSAVSAMLAMPFLPAMLAMLAVSAMAMDAGRAAIGAEPSGRVALMSPQFRPIVVSGGLVYAANTPHGTVDILDPQTRQTVRRVAVGIEPVGLAVRPDGRELWVANHVSDSLSIIDLAVDSPTRWVVIDTLQDIDAKTKATRFDEPVGIAFASNEKAYVSLSSENEIAVIDVPSRMVAKRLKIPAQDPRAMAVRGDRLYVLPFESNNQTQLSGGKKSDIDGNLVTFDIWEHSIRHNNVLSIGHVIDIVKHPQVPDRDLFVFDTANDTLVETVSSLGTLLYGVAVDSQGQVFVAQTDARNHVNGRAGTKKHGLAELENRPFLNRVTRVARGPEGRSTVSWIDLEPLPPAHPAPEAALATPAAVELSQDDKLLFVAASGSDALAILDAATGQQLGRCAVGAVPQGIAIEHRDGKPFVAWVLNAAANTVSQVSVADPRQPRLIAEIALEDPTDAAVKRGRIAFSTARASSTGTFSCASCHPDGHTDQLLWVLAPPVVTGGDQIMPRSTMPVRGLRDTAPFHWDGIPGDPYGGIHSASIRRPVEPNSRLDSPESTTRHLIDGGLASTMARVGDTAKNDQGQPGRLSDQERADMARFLLQVPYPPAPRRAYDNQLTDEAQRGFRLFHIDGDLDPGKSKPNVCGDCHRLPHWVSTNTPGTGMDAPTWRGAYDRWLILPQGRLNVVELGFFRNLIEQGAPERNIWRLSWGGRTRFDPVWEMVLQGSTGFPGAFARQVTLNRRSAASSDTTTLAQALIDAARQGTVKLVGAGIRLQGAMASPCEVRIVPGISTGSKEAGMSAAELRLECGGVSRPISLDELIAMAARGEFVVTLTALLGDRATAAHPQPELWTSGNIHEQRGRQVFPIMTGETRTITLSGRYFDHEAHLLVDGVRVAGKIDSSGGEELRIELATVPTPGLHFLQVQVPGGFISNDFLFHTVPDRAAALALQESLDEPHSESGMVRRALKDPGKINERLANGSTPLGQAALWGQLSLVRDLLEKGADVKATNRDGNTALHLAAFMCHEEVVALLKSRGADLEQKNAKGETPFDVVSGRWSEELAAFYRQLGVSLGLPVDTTRLERSRPRIATLLKERGPRQ